MYKLQGQAVSFRLRNARTCSNTFPRQDHVETANSAEFLDIRSWQAKPPAPPTSESQPGNVESPAAGSSQGFRLPHVTLCHIIYHKVSCPVLPMTRNPLP